jgi:ubiquinone/menaquinone biosynthesis C-methylase UbiE
MARLMRDTLPGVKIVGIDIVKPIVKGDTSLAFAQADVTRIPLADNSVDNATMFWSEFNDLTAPQQREQFIQDLRRVMNVDGEIYIGTPHLEGGEGSWMTAAQEYHRAHPDAPFGRIQTTITDRTKIFDILPQEAIRAHFESAGFSLTDEITWRTLAGKPRKDYVFRLRSKSTAIKP